MVVLLIPDRLQSKKKMTGDKDIYWGKIMILIVYAAYNKASKYMKQWIQLKGEIHKFTNTVSGLNIPLSATDNTFRQEFSKNIQDRENPRWRQR